MKFGKIFESYKIPEWYEYYLDYKGIKTVLNFLDKRQTKKAKLKKLKILKSKYEKKYKSKEISDSKRSASIITIDSFNAPDVKDNPYKTIKNKNKKKRIIETEDLSILNDEEKIIKFLEIYKNKLKVIDDFFKKKLGQFFGDLNKIEFKMNTIESSINDESFLFNEINPQNDAIEYAVSWKRALSLLYRKTTWLHSYHSINSLAVKKIEKKIIKIFKLYDIDISKELEKVSESFQIFNYSLKKLIELRIEIKKLYSQKFTKGKDDEAKIELEKGLQGKIGKSKSHLICFYLGFLAVFIFNYIIYKNIDGKNKNDSFKPFFPFFNFSYIIILAINLLGINMTILQHYKINYVYLFDLAIKNKVNSYDVFELALGLSSLWIFFFVMTKLSLKFGLFGGEYTLFPLLMNLSLVIIFFLPFSILYLNARKGLIKVLFNVFFPIGKNSVKFKESMLGDVFISLSEPFKNLLLGYCLMVCHECYLNNSRGPCNKESIPCWIISVYPQFIRITQNINRLYYTNICWPHAGNLIKYCIRFINTSLGFFYERDKGAVRFYFRVFVGAISTSYNIFWDIYLDWGCLRKNNKNFLLREKITFPPVVYYLAIFYDIIIRGAWTWYFIPVGESLIEWKYLLKDTLEVTRRGLWALIRIENEHLTNPEYYRSFLIIPDLPTEEIN